MTSGAQPLKWEAVLPIGPYSVNQLFYRDGRIKKTETKAWEESIATFLYESGQGAKLKKLGELYDSKQHQIHVVVEARYPEKKFYNRSGEISAKTMDITNFEKPLVDVLFLPRLADQYVYPNFGHDDKHITQLISRKSAYSSSDVSLSIAIELVPISSR